MRLGRTRIPLCAGVPLLPRITPGAEALEKLTVSSGFMLVDGQGLAHPLRFGLACHLGFLADVPTIGLCQVGPGGQARPSEHRARCRGADEGP